MIYLDNAATAKPNAEALGLAREAIECFYNPSARYGGGFEAASIVKRARESLISYVADPLSFGLIFTSGGTESDNHAVFSGARRGNAVTTAGEHAAVYESFLRLRERGVEPRFAPVGKDGKADPDALLALVDDKTSLVSVVHVNNETGAVNDIAALAKAVKKKNPRCLFHSDGVQAFGKLSFRLPPEVDLYSVGAHKLGGLKGTGGLFKKRELALAPYLCGGGQEGGLRSGTENTFGISVFAHAARIRFSSLREDYARMASEREFFFSSLDPQIFTRISLEDGSPYILTVYARGTRGEVLQRMLFDRGVAVGTGSACSSKKPYSRVIEACGFDREALGGVLRASFSPETTHEELARAADLMNEAAREYKEKV